MDTHRILKLASRVIFIIVLVSIPALAGDVRADASRPDSPDRQRIFLPSISSQDPDQTLRANVPADPVILRRLASGAPVHGANGLAFGPDGRLYIGSVGHREIVVMDPDSGEILDRIGPERGVESPDDLTFGPDGSLYWTALFTGEVGKLLPDGKKVTVATLPLGVNPITFSDTGRLFVALDFFGDALYELDPQGDPDQVPQEIATNLGFLNGMDWGLDGHLYGPLLKKGQIVRIDVDTGTIEMVSSGFTYPTAVKFNSKGELFAVDQSTGEVIQVDKETGDKKVVSTLDPGLDNLAFSPSGRLFVSSNHDGTVWEVFPDGRSRVVSPGGMVGPAGLALLSSPDGGETLFVADIPSLRGFDSQSGRLVYHERSLTGINQLVWPLTASPDGKNLVISSWFQNAVQVWNPDANQALETYFDFAVPLNAIRFQGDLIVAELGSHDIVRMDAEGKRTVLTNQMVVPAGLAATEDNLWAGDWATGKIWQLVKNGKTMNAPRLVAEGLMFPEGMAVAPDEKSLIVVETGAGRLSRIKLSNGSATPILSGLEIGFQGPETMPPTYVFNGVSVSTSGSIFVGADRTGVLYRIDTHP